MPPAKKEERRVKVLEIDPDAFVINGPNLRALYESCELKESWTMDEAVEEWDEIVPPVELQRKVREHFKKRPFDKLKWGLLKIETKTKGLQWFDLNDEQMEVMEWIEQEFYSQRPIRVIALKGRQIGLSTLCDGATYCICSSGTFNNFKTHIVADLDEKCKNIIGMFDTFWEYEPLWLRPNKQKISNPLTFDDKDKGVRRVRIHHETAERRSRTSRSFTFLVNHFTEVPYWPPDYQEEILNSLDESVPEGWPSIIFDESTGNRRNDRFFQRYMSAKNGELGHYKAFFFAWFKHKEHRRKLPDGMKPDVFKNSLDELDRSMWDTYKLDAEQVYWYTFKRSQRVSMSDGGTVDLFKRENPSCEEDCFLGAQSNYFDPDRNKRDFARTSEITWKKYDQLPVSCSGVDQPVKIAVAKCDLETDWACDFKLAKFKDNVAGRWTIFERPRAGHKYIVSGDIASGKLAQKNLRTSVDFTDIEVLRYTYEAGEKPMMVQVAQFRSQSVEPQDSAREMIAAAVLYMDDDSGLPALIIPEQNNEGAATIDEIQNRGHQHRMYRRVVYGQRGEPVGEKYGFRTTQGRDTDGSKSRVCAQLRTLWNQDGLLLNSQITVREMGVFVNEEGRLCAFGTNHDDSVSGMVFAVEGVRFDTTEVRPIMVEKKRAKIENVREPQFEPLPKINVQARIAKLCGISIEDVKTGSEGSKLNYARGAKWGGEVFDTREYEVDELAEIGA